MSGLLDEVSRQKLDVFLRKMMHGLEIDMRAERRNGKPTHAPFCLAVFQRPDSIFDLSYLPADLENGRKARWVTWKEVQIATVYQSVSGERMEDLVVPTMDFVRYNCLLGWFFDARCPILMNGPPACGKTLYLRQKMQNYLPASKFLKSFLQMSPSTTPKIAHHVIWEKLEAVTLGKMAPKEHRHLVLLVEDLNLASRDKYGCSSTHELMRHLLGKQSGYTMTTPPVLHRIDKVLMAATDQHSHGSVRQAISLRLKRHFIILNVVMTKDEELGAIFSRSLQWYHDRQGFPEAITSLRERVVSASLAIYQQVIPVKRSSLHMDSLS